MQRSFKASSQPSLSTFSSLSQKHLTNIFCPFDSCCCIFFFCNLCMWFNNAAFPKLGRQVMHFVFTVGSWLQEKLFYDDAPAQCPHPHPQPSLIRVNGCSRSLYTRRLGGTNLYESIKKYIKKYRNTFLSEHQPTSDSMFSLSNVFSPQKVSF